MKKLFFLLALMPMLLSAKEVRIMVIADPHVLAPELMNEHSKSFQEMMEGQRKMLHLSAETFETLMEEVGNVQPDILLIPGDLTKDGEVASHDFVLSRLRSKASSDLQIYVIPGNHDIGGKTYKYLGDEKEKVDSCTHEQWNREYYDNLMRTANPYAHTMAKDVNSHSFSIDAAEGLTLIGIDGSDNDAGEPKLNQQTLSFVAQAARQAREKGHMVIAMSHWQILEHFDQQGTLISSSRFANANEVRTNLVNSGVQMVLTGHFHVNGITTYKDTLGLSTDSLIEITTGAPITYPCPYRLLTVSEDRSSVAVETRFITALPSQPDLMTYSREWMSEHTTNLIPGLTLRGFDAAEKILNSISEEQLAETGLSTLFEPLKDCIPQTDEEKIDLVQRNLGEALVNLYLLHSEANEPEHADAQAMADSIYVGMSRMMNEMLGKSTNSIIQIGLRFGALDFIINMPQTYAEPIVQSMVEDVTNRSSALYSNRTDDLRALFVINDAYQGSQDINHVFDPSSKANKIIQNGQFLIQRGGKTYTAIGQIQ